MYRELTNFDDLKSLVREDKSSIGMDATTRNRYPIRFVLFDDFKQCNAFVDFVQSEIGAVVHSVDKWMDPKYPELMLTYVQLASNIKNYIKHSNGTDSVIAPFSELARFYDNEQNKTFEALLKTIKAIEASPIALEKHQRIYMPIVGLEGKMEPFTKDSQSIIWRLKTPEHHSTYRLILTDNTSYGVNGLDSHYTIVHNILEWLSIWKDSAKQANSNIICTSHSIFANAKYAKPDNAFEFATCENAYDFLVKGLNLKLGNIAFVPGEETYWEELAQLINVSKDFDFSKFIHEYYNISSLYNYETFIKLWLDKNGKFDRWLLARYYQSHSEAGDYIGKILAETKAFIGNDFVERMAMNFTSSPDEIRIRRYCLTEAAKKHVVMRNEVQSIVVKRLEAIADKYNATSALKYFTGISDREKELAVSWLGRGLIECDKLKNIFPDLYYYLYEPIGISYNIPEWVSPYFDAYKKAKIRNRYTDEINEQINKLNSSEVTFDSWYQDFCTTRTLMMKREDIDVYFWIDGLGIDWIPLVKKIINERNKNGIYLNEVKIARALLPTITSVNKPDLQKLLPEGDTLEKIGDLDSLAHQSTNVWPKTIVQEVEKVREIIETILDKYNGKRIAIISDHGLTYLSQLCKGLGLPSVESDHHGRIAIRKDGKWTKDNNYMVLEDGITACALNHKSLCEKVPSGQGIHGGCTPEEVLVPIFIISNKDTAIEWTAELLTTEISGANPILKYEIKNIPSVDIPYIVYDGKKYNLHLLYGNTYESDPLIVNPDVTEVSLYIGSMSIEKEIQVTSGATENDLFDF